MDDNSRNLKRRAAAGIVRLAVVLGLLLFVPAATLDFWQGWVLGLVFVISSLLITVYFLRHDPKLIERRLKAGPRAETDPNQKAIQMLASVLFVLLIVIPALDHRLGWSRVPDILAITADLFVALGFLVTFLVFRENSFASATIEVMRDQTVISTGPYKIVRHPMYAGALLMFVGSPLALGSYWGLIVAPPMAAVLIWRLLDEEKLLAKDLPGYDEYRRLTRYRLVPYVW